MSIFQVHWFLSIPVGERLKSHSGYYITISVDQQGDYNANLKDAGNYTVQLPFSIFVYDGCWKYLYSTKNTL